MSTPSPTSDGAKGLAALRCGDVAAAAPLLRAAFAQNDANPDVLLAAALTARAQSDFDSCLRATDRLLESAPQHVQANIIKGDALSAMGRPRTAGDFYIRAHHGGGEEPRSVSLVAGVRIWF